MTALGERAIFLAEGYPFATALFTTDGTPEGTTRLAVVDSESALYIRTLDGASVVRGRAYFFATTNYASTLVWTDGISPGLHRAADDFPIDVGPSLPIGNLGDRLIFPASDTAHGEEPWISDGTPGGAKLIADLSRSNDGAGLGGLARIGDRLTAFATAGNGPNVWATAPHTRAIAPIGAVGSPRAAPTLLGVWNGRSIVHSPRWDTGTNAMTISSSDGTPGGTLDLATIDHIDTGPPSGVPSPEGVWFVVNDKVWVSDGTAIGTHPVLSGNGQWRPWVGTLANLQGRLVGLRTLSGTNTAELFITNTDPSTPTPLHAFALPTSASVIARMTELPGRVVFLMTDAEHGTEPWATDGTPEGTVLLADIVPGPDSSSAHTDFIRAGNNAYFATDDPDAQIWATDGTPGGTHPVPGTRGMAGALSATAAIADSSGRLFFMLASGPASGLWVIDQPSTPARALSVGGPARSPAGWIVADGRTVYIGVAEYTGLFTEVWRADGAPDHTVRLGRIPNLPEYAGAVYGWNPPAAIDPANHRLVFACQTTTVGTELFAISLCPADFDGLPGVGSIDIFAFVNAWMNKREEADVNHSGSVTVQDLFDFLAAYFHGC